MGAYSFQRTGETKNHSVDWGDWLDGSDSIASATFALTPAVNSPAETVVDLGESGNVSTARISNLMAGQVYTLTCTMISTGGEHGQQTINIRAEAP